MVFSSLTFLYIFLPVTLVIYYIVPKQLRNLFILISGLFFYAWGEPIYVFVLIASTMIDYFAGLVIYKAGDRQALRKLALILASTPYIPDDYIYDYNIFKNMKLWKRSVVYTIVQS